MQAYWTTTKPDGTPITDGRKCRVVDPEDGTLPIYVYGKTAEEVYSKIERTMMTAQATLTTSRQPANGGAQLPANRAGAAPPRSGNRPTLSADETMALTADLTNPAKSAQASFKLQQSEQNKRLNAQEQFNQICLTWEAAHPEFFGHKTNKTLLLNKAFLTVGNDVARVTSEVLDECYKQLEAGGYLLTESEVVAEKPANNNHEPSAAQPGGNPESVPARPGSGVVSTTSHRSARLSSVQAPKWQPKLSLAEINKLTTKDTGLILRGTHPKVTRKDYDEACDYHFGAARATA